ncbi:protein of unknown function [Pseudomonas inefficax]|uniref:Uncharacterized protein n=1 Tax=Pseudomonas inefficax TaxID=2078786 RepID=A0AAQ1PDZ1_9PSED|nr:protein of unknown function [Pseudomonas inefficax]
MRCCRRSDALALPGMTRRRHPCVGVFVSGAQLPVGAGLPANTGEVRAIHRVACFAGEPAPTMSCVRRQYVSPARNSQ